MGLVDFLSEVNDCQKNLLRIMKIESPSNYLYIYVIDFIWKLILIRFEYHLDDEEQRLRKVEKYYKEEKQKEVKDNE
jgi:hypothetical protein